MAIRSHSRRTQAAKGTYFSHYRLNYYKRKRRVAASNSRETETVARKQHDGIRNKTCELKNVGTERELVSFRCISVLSAWSVSLTSNCFG